MAARRDRWVGDPVPQRPRVRLVDRHSLRGSPADPVLPNVRRRPLTRQDERRRDNAEQLRCVPRRLGERCDARPKLDSPSATTASNSGPSAFVMVTTESKGRPEPSQTCSEGLEWPRVPRAGPRRANARPLGTRERAPMRRQSYRWTSTSLPRLLSPCPSRGGG